MSLFRKDCRTYRMAVSMQPSDLRRILLIRNEVQKDPGQRGVPIEAFRALTFKAGPWSPFWY